MTPKPGYLTTEFWLHLLVTLLSLALASGVLPPNWASIIGVALSVLSAVGYSAARAAVKGTASISEATQAKHGLLQAMLDGVLSAAAGIASRGSATPYDPTKQVTP